MDGGKLLGELKVADLRRELEKRQKDKNGVKQALIDRLRETLEGEGVDPSTYVFQSNEVNGKSGTDSVESPVNGAAPTSLLTENAQTPTGDPSVETEGLETTSDGEQKKPSEEPVPYVVQVGEQEEDLDYDLKLDTSVPTKGMEDPKTTSTDVQPDSNLVHSTTESEGQVDVSANEEQSTAIVRTGNVTKKNLWVSNLPQGTKAADLKQHFSRFGKVVSATIVMNTRSPGGCFGFLQMATPEDAKTCALKINGTDLNGSQVTVEATQREAPSRPSTMSERTESNRVARTDRGIRSDRERVRNYHARGRRYFPGAALLASRRRLAMNVAARRQAFQARAEPMVLRSIRLPPRSAEYQNRHNPIFRPLRQEIRPLRAAYTGEMHLPAVRRAMRSFHPRVLPRPLPRPSTPEYVRARQFARTEVPRTVSPRFMRISGDDRRSSRPLRRSRSRSPVNRRQLYPLPMPPRRSPPRIAPRGRGSYRSPGYPAANEQRVPFDRRRSEDTRPFSNRGGISPFIRRVEQPTRRPEPIPREVEDRRVRPTIPTPPPRRSIETTRVSREDIRVPTQRRPSHPASIPMEDRNFKPAFRPRLSEREYMERPREVRPEPRRSDPRPLLRPPVDKDKPTMPPMRSTGPDRPFVPLRSPFQEGQRRSFRPSGERTPPNQGPSDGRSSVIDYGHRSEPSRMNWSANPRGRSSGQQQPYASRYHY